MSINAIRKYEQSKGAFTLLASQSVRLPFFLDAGRRHETSGLKTEDFITHNNSNGQNISICDSPMSPSSHRVTRQSPGDACTCSGLCYRKRILRFVVDFQLLSHVQLFVIPWTVAPGFPVLNCPQILLKFMSIELVMPSNHLILCHPLLILPSVLPSIRVFSSELVLYIMWPKYWSFSTSSSNEYSGFISFRIGWFDLFAVQGTLKSLFQ